MNAIEVLLAVRGYVKHFFGCDECRRNFLRGAVHMDDTVLTDRDAVMFLWRSHNKANYHLRRDLTEDPQHPKVQFPDPSQCLACHFSAVNGSVVWNEDFVFRFLSQMYSRLNVVRDSESVGMRPVQFRWKNSDKSSEDGDVDYSVNATQLDISLCLAFYGLCSGLLGLLYCRFCRRFRSRKNSSSSSSSLV